jgi:hypothetical protein
MNLIKKYLNKKTIIFTMIAMLLLTSATLAAGSIVKNPHESEYGKFVLGPEMKIPRYGHHAVLLDDGRALVTEGISKNDGNLKQSEIYDPAKNEFVLGPVMNEGRVDPGVVKLNNGQILFVGGYSDTAEIYDPTKNVFILLDYKFPKKLRNHTATILKDGKVLIAAGSYIKGYHKEAYIYNSETQKFTRTGDLHAGRRYHKAVLLDNGKVWIVGGQRDDKKHEISELYNPKTGKFEEWVAISENPYKATITKLKDGKILLSGGYISPNAKLAKFSSFKDSYIFDLNTAKFTRTEDMQEPRNGHKGTLLNNCLVLITSGVAQLGFKDKYYQTAEVYDPEQRRFLPAGEMYYKRSAVCQATLLKNGNVLITGGVSSRRTNDYVSQSEIFIPSKKGGK